MSPDNNKNLNGIKSRTHDLAVTDPYLVSVVNWVSENTAVAMDDLVATSARSRTEMLQADRKI